MAHRPRTGQSIGEFLGAQSRSRGQGVEPCRSTVIHFGTRDLMAVLEISHRLRRCRVLGPGLRAVVWVQGCPLRCAGCVFPEGLEFGRGEIVETDALAAEILADPTLDGVTFSGGEPMSQAEGLVQLVERVRADRPELSVMVFTGWVLERLQDVATPAQKRLLGLTDILVDGPYVSAKHTDLRWRGSENQRIHLLTGRHRDVDLGVRGQWLEFHASGATLTWVGIPPEGFRAELEGELRSRGIDLRLLT